MPEIQRSHLAASLLQLKALGIDNIMTFPWLDPPPAETAVRAMEQLYALGAVNEHARCDPLHVVATCYGPMLVLWGVRSPPSRLPSVSSSCVNCSVLLVSLVGKDKG